ATRSSTAHPASPVCQSFPRERRDAGRSATNCLHHRLEGSAGAERAVSIGNKKAGARMTTRFDGVRAIALVACLAAWTAAARAELKPGMVLNQETWQQAEGLLPPEILKHYENGDYANVIADWPLGVYLWPPDFKAASEKNAGQLDLNDNGTIIEKGSNKQPPYVMGFPFPIIDPADPKAATKILWNYFYRSWYFGSLRAESQLNWVAAKNLERRTDVEADFEYYDGIPPDERLTNSENFSVRMLAVPLSPAHLHAPAALTRPL